MAIEGVRPIGGTVVDRLFQRIDYLDNVPRARSYIEQHGQEVTERLQQYADMIVRLNVFLSGSDPHVVVFGHILSLRNKLLTIGITQLPTIQQMQNEPRFMWSFGRGFNRAIDMMINGHEHVYGVGNHQNSDRVDVTAKREVSDSNLIIGGLAHVIEQTYIAWLKQKGLVLTKDEVLSAIDEATRSTFSTDEASPLIRPFMQLGWIKKDRVAEMLTQTKMLDNALAVRDPSTAHIRESYYKAPFAAQAPEDVAGLPEFGEMYSLGTFVSGNALFHIVREELWRQREGGYFAHSFYTVEVLAANDPIQGFVFNDGEYSYPRDNQTYGTLYFFYNGETEADGVQMYRTRNGQWHDHEGKMVRSLGSTPDEINRIVSERIRQNPIHRRILSN